MGSPTAPLQKSAANGAVAGEPAGASAGRSWEEVGGAPLAVDLCCGRGGWTKGLAAAGFQVVGVDVLPQPAYPVGAAVDFVQEDVRSLRAHELRLRRRPYLVVASPPCEGFSTLRPNKEDPPDPEPYELVASCLRLIAELRPRFWVIENVRGAWKWWKPLLGDPDLKDPPYYLWGHLPPEMRPQGPYPSKLRYRDPGRRSEIPAQLAEPLGRHAMREWRRDADVGPFAGIGFSGPRPLPAGAISQRLHAGAQSTATAAAGEHGAADPQGD